MKRKILIVLLSIVCAACFALGLTACDKSSADLLEYTLSADGESYVVSGIGTCTDTEIEIPLTHEGLAVTAIGDEAFYRCSKIVSITIPDSVTFIDEWAFGYCSSLTSVSIPDSVISIGDRAFYNCNSLTSAHYSGTASQWTSISFGYTTANPLCYAGNLYLNGTLATDITIENIDTINDYAFYGCTSLTSVIISDDVTSIGSSAFGYCSSLTSVSISDSVTSIGDWAFAYCSSLESIIIPNSVTSIDDFAFYYCTSLTSVVISDGVTSIGDWAFGVCPSLISITIPDSVTFIGSGAFRPSVDGGRESNLTSVMFENTSGWYVTKTEGDTSGTSISSKDLSDASTAANYLTSTSYYSDYYWYRK